MQCSSPRVSIVILGLIVSFAAYSSGQVPRGVTRQLAADRASRVSDVRYTLHFELNKQAKTVIGTEELQFRLSRPIELLLDYRDGVASNLVLNGTAVPIVNENGHIVLPANVLLAGDNRLNINFISQVAPAGKAITRYEDKDDGSIYLYTLFVPMDASMAFPCFDQPDLKGRFTLNLNVPTDWKAISNAPVRLVQSMGAVSVYSFEETRPISTYLFAFAAGPFEKLQGASGLPDVFVRKSQLERARPEIPQIQDVTAKGIAFFGAYFAQPYPFPKYDMVLLPGFPYGGMEHAGATFLNEDSMLFRTAPTGTDRFNRSIVLLHELAHQWFGDFTTMRWFDDLWLKEGFAEYMAFRGMADIAPDQDVWARFYQQIKPSAYSTDITKGTTPLYQDIPNLLDAKSAYGSIVYSKAPGLLRQLAFLIGDDAFRNGLRLYLREHGYSNATWSDLTRALEKASGQDLQAWAQAWIQNRGLPVITVDWHCDGKGKLQNLTLHQHDVLDEGHIWPYASEVLLGYADAPPATLRVQVHAKDTSVTAAAGRSCPAFVFANSGDYAYGMFLLDARSRDYVRTHVEHNSDLLTRALLWGALWDSVRFAEMPPSDYLDATRRALPSESNEVLVRSLAGRSASALHRYVSNAVRSQLTPNLESLAIDGMLHKDDIGLRIMWFRSLIGFANSPAGLNALRDMLDGKSGPPGVNLRSVDRWNMVAALIAMHDAGAERVFEEQKKRDPTGDGLKYAYVVAAATPDAEKKAWYFDDNLHNSARPEDWVQASLAPFNEWNQSDLTLPFLRPALEALPQIKEQRKIFFVLAWLNAFIDGQHSAEADTEVHAWLDHAQLDPDLRRKVLEVVDELDRTVRIRQKFP